MKKCSGCKLQKSLDAFHKNARQYDGVHDACKECRKIESKKYTVKTIKKRSAYKKHKYNNNIEFKISESIRNRLRNVLIREQKKGSAIKDLGCTVTQLKGWLESQFEVGMNWNNYGKGGWHIDHIIPLSKFDLTNRVQFLKACHWFNLRPLWEIENLSRGNKIT